MPQVLVNVIVDKDKKAEYKTDEVVCEAIAKAECSLIGRGRVLVRASGTEPLLRIMLEGEDKQEISQYAVQIAQAMVDRLGGVVKH
jgi:phosphoglucosamine mutase